MSTGKAIYGILSADSDVSTNVSTRIYPDHVPQNASFPYIAYTVISTTPSHEKDGVSQLDSVSVQVDIYSQSYATTQTIAGYVRTALDRYSGTVSSVNVQSIKFENESSQDYEKDLGVFWVSQDYTVRVLR